MDILFEKKEDDLIIQVWEINDSLQELKNICPKEYVPKYSNKKKEKENIATNIVLKKIDPKIKLSYNKYNAPIISNGKNISISHSKKFLGIIISNKNVGIDLEEISDKALNVSSKFMNKTNSLTKEVATLIWSAKETIYKYHQKGGLDFKKDMKINPFILKEKGILSGSLRHKNILLQYKRIKNCFLVYVCK